jgi:hypothetical protein
VFAEVFDIIKLLVILRAAAGLSGVVLKLFDGT